MHAVTPVERLAATGDRRAAAIAELARILESPSFRGSKRCCRFLDYSVQHVIEGDSQEALRERNIGIDVFQRPPDYDTAEDAIVRVTANEVRKRLAQYYQESREQANPVITLPPGSYGALLTWKAAPISEPAEPAAPPPAPGPRRMRYILLGIALIAAAYFGVNRQKGGPAADALWSGIFRDGQKTNILMADAARFEMEQLLGRNILLREYLSSEYPQNLLDGVKPDLQRVIRFMGTRQTTSVGSATIGPRLVELGRRYGVHPVLRHPRHVNVREFQTDNFILLGSRLSIPWVELFEPSLNYAMEQDPETHLYYLRNRAPADGEPVTFRQSPTRDETWVDVAVVPNTGRQGSVLILNAIDMVGVEAAAEFAINGSLSQALPPGRPAEVLLRVRAIGGTASSVEIAKVREVQPAALDLELPPGR
jgi:hypothetical protein